MHLLSLTLQKPLAINAACYGNFSDNSKFPEIVVSRINRIELLRPNAVGKLEIICSCPVFCVIRSLLAFRLLGSSRDYVIVGSDSGKLAVLEFDDEKNEFKTIHCEPFGKSGCRRVVPGQYLCCDPNGRAIMVSAAEGSKLIFIMNRDASNRLTISSPLEANKASTIIFSTCGVDVGTDNPTFACIELEYTPLDSESSSSKPASDVEKLLTYYEVDLGLNHVTRKWSEPIARNANILVSVPGGDDGPSGVLICGENWIAYMHQGHVEVRAPIPRRRDLPVERGVLITSIAMHKPRSGGCFYLAQSEFGDVYKVNLMTEIDDGGKMIVKDIAITVFDSIKPANFFCVTRNGLLFVASEFGSHLLYKIVAMDDGNDQVVSHAIPSERNQEYGDFSDSSSQIAPVFDPSHRLRNLTIADEMQSLCPLTNALVGDYTGEIIPQIYALCGQDQSSSIKILRHGLSVSLIADAAISGTPTNIWTIPHSHDNPTDKYIIISFFSSTLVLSIGDNIQQVTDSGFVTSTMSIFITLLADGSMIQVYSAGIRHIHRDNRIVDWKSPGRGLVERASGNERQLVISLSGGQLIYFELDAANQLSEVMTKELGEEIVSLDVGDIPNGRLRCDFLAVGCLDGSVRLLSLDPSELMSQRSRVQIQAKAESVCLANLDYKRGMTTDATDSSLYLHIGTATGIVVRLTVDEVDGSLSDTRQRLIGTKPVVFYRVWVEGRRGIMALSSRPWLIYRHQAGQYYQSPLSNCLFDACASFSSDAVNGVVAANSTSLKIFTIDTLGQLFNQSSVDLRHTPRRVCPIPGSRLIAVIETDHNSYTMSERLEIQKASNGDRSASSSMTDDGDDDEIDADKKGPAMRGPMPGKDGKWASCLRIMSCETLQTLTIVDIGENEAALSICICGFSSTGTDLFLIIGTTRDMLLHPRSSSCNFIHTYRLLSGGGLEFVHKTPVEDAPQALVGFNGMLLVGLGRTLRLYDMGKKKLLRKIENRSFPTIIVKIMVNASQTRVYVADAAESIHFVAYNSNENALIIFADDIIPRWTTDICLLDDDSVAGGDKFGNIWALRLPEGVRDDDVGNPTGNRMLYNPEYLNGAPIKLQTQCQFYIGEAVTSIVKTSLIPGGEEIILVFTILGSIFALIPCRNREDVDFYSHIEMFIRQERRNLLCQRDHIKYRGYFIPAKAVIDADLCEMFSTLSSAKKQEMAEMLDKSVPDIIKKIEDLRNLLM